MIADDFTTALSTALSTGGGLRDIQESYKPMIDSLHIADHFIFVFFNDASSIAIYDKNGGNANIIKAVDVNNEWFPFEALVKLQQIKPEAGNDILKLIDDTLSKAQR